MKKFDLDLFSTNTFPITHFFGEDYGKKELKGNDYLLLFGALSLICENNEPTLNDYNLTMADVIGAASICSDELCLNNFNGYQISERLTLESLYLTKYNGVMMSVFDKKKERYLEFMV